MSEAAKEIGVTYNQLSYWVKIGRVPCFRYGKKGRPRFSQEHIDQIKSMVKKWELDE